MVETNRRHSPRQNEDTTIQVIYSPEDQRGDRDRLELMPAQICNRSQEGLYVETDQILESGSNIIIKMVAPDCDLPENICYVMDGRVVWHKKIQAGTPRFGVGVKILRRVVQADILTSHFR